MSLCCPSPDGNYGRMGCQLHTSMWSSTVITVIAVVGTILGAISLSAGYGLIGGGLLANLGIGGSWGLLGGSLGTFVVFALLSVVAFSCNACRVSIFGKNTPLGGDSSSSVEDEEVVVPLAKPRKTQVNNAQDAMKKAVVMMQKYINIDEWDLSWGLLANFVGMDEELFFSAWMAIWILECNPSDNQMRGMLSAVNPKAMQDFKSIRTRLQALRTDTGLSNHAIVEKLMYLQAYKYWQQHKDKNDFWADIDEKTEFAKLLFSTACKLCWGIDDPDLQNFALIEEPEIAINCKLPEINFPNSGIDKNQLVDDLHSFAHGTLYQGRAALQKIKELLEGLKEWTITS